MPSISLNNIIPFSNLLLNSYFKNSTIELYVQIVLNMHVNFRTNQLYVIYYSI